MKMHFEDLWEKCENFHKQTPTNQSTILDELILKLTLYKALSDKVEVADEEFQKIKSRTLGEILLTLTNLSLQDNINVFEALNTALYSRTINHYDKIHSV